MLSVPCRGVANLLNKVFNFLLPREEDEDVARGFGRVNIQDCLERRTNVVLAGRIEKVDIDRVGAAFEREDGDLELGLVCTSTGRSKVGPKFLGVQCC